MNKFIKFLMESNERGEGNHDDVFFVIEPCITESVDSYVPTNGDSFQEWFDMVKESKYMLWLTPCRPELTYEENHQRAESFMSDLKALQYGSMIDGVGQFIIHKIGMVNHTEEKDVHVDTFAIMYEKEHSDYIHTFLPKLIEKHGVRFHMEFNNGVEDDHLVAIKFDEDCSTPFDKIFCGLAETTQVYDLIGNMANPITVYVEPKRLAIAGFGDITDEYVFEVEDVSVMTNPASFTDAMRLSGIAKRFGVTVNVSDTEE